MFWKSAWSFSQEQLANPMQADNNFTENFIADVPAGTFRNIWNNIHSCFCCFHGFFEILGRLGYPAPGPRLSYPAIGPRPS